MKKISVLISLLIGLNLLWGASVTRNEAIEIGRAFARQMASMQDEQISIAAYRTNPEADLVDLYILSLQPQGFIIVAAEDKTSPILAYSFESNFPLEELPEQVREVLDSYSNDISELRQQAEIKRHEEWNKISSGDVSSYMPSRNVSPLLNTTWNQNFPYNYNCPFDLYGSGLHANAGSVAVAMAQIMKKWNHPITGLGSKTYNSPGYGTQSVNFSTGNYNWPAMSNTASSLNSSISKLIYHCGVAVETMYGTSASTASVTDVRDAFVNHFRFHNGSHYEIATAYSAYTWANMLREDIDRHRPVFYHTTGSQGTHAFVMDGYQGNNMFHCNWGWGGSYNGYYFWYNLNPNGNSFTQNHSAVFYLMPPSFGVLYGQINFQYGGCNDAIVTLENIDTGDTNTDYHNHDGFYYVIGIQAGHYRITVSDPYCYPAIDSLYVQSGEYYNRDYFLELRPVLPRPTNFQASVDFNTVNLSWQVPSPVPSLNLTGFRIRRGNDVIANITNPAINTYSDIGLATGTYAYSVWAIYDEGDSNPTNLNVSVTVAIAPQIFRDGFEDYPDFATNFPPWFLIDEDLTVTEAFSGISYPNSNTPKAFMIFNPSTCIPEFTEANARTGSKMAVCFVSENQTNSDWMISPPLRLGTDSSLRFYAKSHSEASGLARFKVGISTTSASDPAAFTYLTGDGFVTVPSTWTEYQYNLSAYNNTLVYIAIRCVSDNALALFMDDFSVHSNLGSSSDPFGQPSGFPSTTHLFARVNIAGVSASVGDVLAAFTENEGTMQLRGKQMISVSDGIAWCYLPIYTAENGETIVFRVWDESTTQVFSSNASLSTEVGATIGSFPDALFLINGLTATQQIAEPTFSPSPGLYHTQQYVSISCSDDRATIYYTKNGSEPTLSSTIYRYPLVLNKNTNTTIKAKAFVLGYTPSQLGIANFQITDNVAVPVFSPSAGYYTTAIDVAISCPSPNAEIRYTTDDSEPNESSPLYSEPIRLESHTALRAKAFIPDWLPSALNTAVYHISVNNADDIAPIVTGISAVYPNPFNRELYIKLGVGKEGSAYQLRIYNIKGERVFSQDGYAKGNFDFIWDGKGNSSEKLPSGVYLISFESTGVKSTRKVFRF